MIGSLCSLRSICSLRSLRSICYDLLALLALLNLLALLDLLALLALLHLLDLLDLLPLLDLLDLQALSQSRSDIMFHWGTPVRLATLMRAVAKHKERGRAKHDSNAGCQDRKRKNTTKTQAPYRCGPCARRAFAGPGRPAQTSAAQFLCEDSKAPNGPSRGPGGRHELRRPTLPGGRHEPCGPNLNKTGTSDFVGAKTPFRRGLLLLLMLLLLLPPTLEGGRCCCKRYCCWWGCRWGFIRW